MFEMVLSFLEEFRRNFRVADAVDILLMSVLVYSALLWFKETASKRMVIGVWVLAFVYFMARALNMYLTSLVFHTGFAVFLVVLVVIFQEDLRRMFERVAGWGSLRRLRQHSVVGDDIQALVDAVFSMAASHTGLLIVLKGSDPLDRQLDGGIPLGGVMSVPLLCSIFDPSSPGHDGAAVIQGDRVQMFGAHLPVSRHQRELAGRGTRHRAALGLSERADALVIVGSEERGAVSVAQNGRLRDITSPAAFRNRVDDFLETKFPKAGSAAWHRFMAEHWRLKLAATTLAIAAWFVLAYNPSTIHRTFVVPIEYRNVADNLLLDQYAPVEGRIILSGS